MTTADTPVDAPRRLTRSRDERIVAGVCAGAARYFDIDPVIFRVVLAVLTVFGGAGVVIYAFAWLLMPEDGSPTTRVERWLDAHHSDRRRDLLIAMSAVVIVVFLAGGHLFARRFSFALFLVVLALTIVALVGRARGDRWHRSTTMTAPLASNVPYGPATSWQQSSWEQALQPIRRPHSVLGWLVIGTTFLVIGVLAAIAFSGLAHPQPADVLAAAVAVIGLGLVVGGFVGRAWLMIPLGLVLVGCLGVADAVPRDLTWSSGTRTWTPTSSVEQSPYVLGAGQATLDLSGVDPHQSQTYVSRMGAGRLIVLVPRGAVVDVHARISAGRLVVFGREDDGTGLDINRDIGSDRPHAGTVTLDLNLGFGDVEVRNAAA